VPAADGSIGEHDEGRVKVARVGARRPFAATLAPVQVVSHPQARPGLWPIPASGARIQHRMLPTLRNSIACVLLGTLSTCLAGQSLAVSLPADFSDQLIAGSLGQPVALAEVPDPASDTTRRVLFVEQRTARVGLVVGASVFTVGTVPGVSAVDNERGLLGVAVDPGWPARPYLYVHCTDGRSGHRIAISRFTLTGDLAHVTDGHLVFDAASRYDLITALPDNASNHNGGTLRFGPDGRLYVSLGDDATGCPAQDSTRLVGKILRLDVSRLPVGAGGPAPYALLAPAGNPYAASADSGARLVWTTGLRNPFRFQVDPQTGALLVADVGENAWEELDLVDAGGMDMGWPLREGPAAFSTCSPPPSTPLTGPIAWYDHSNGAVIIPGPRYRRPAAGAGRFPAAYDGDCFYLDYYVGQVWRITNTGGSWVPAAAVPGQPSASNWATGLVYTADMIELTDGSIWFCQQFAPGSGVGEIHRITYGATSGVTTPPPAGFALAAPWPSPTHGNATISWTQGTASPVQVSLHDLHGRRIRELARPYLSPPGKHDIVWDGRDDAGRQVRPGVYLVRVQVGTTERHARISLVR
jgi:glucose/arabinose dehydrogenase